MDWSRSNHMFTSLSNASKNTMKTSFRSVSICDSLYRHIPTLSNTYDGDYSNNSQCILASNYTAWKVSKYRVFSGPYFPAIGLSTEIYKSPHSVRIQGKNPLCEETLFTHFENTKTFLQIFKGFTKPLCKESEKSCTIDIL